MIKKQDIDSAHQRIKPYIHQTPLISSQTIANMTKCKQFVLKCENLQKVGAFKPRGAFNKVLQLESNIKTVCTHSSGNHAQALAYAAKKLGLQAKIVMPQNSPQIKKQSVKDYGAEVIQSGNTIKQRQSKSEEVSKKYQAYFIHPYNDKQIITGQATCAKQVFQNKQGYQFDYIVFPIGGGGLASGSLLSTKYYGKNCKPIGVQPQLARDAYDSLIKKQIQAQYPPVSIADGLRTSLGPLTYKIISQNLKPEDVILVSQVQILDAMQLVFQRMKLVIQASSATVVAAVLKDKRFIGKRVCCIISGGNVQLSQYFNHLKTKIKAKL